MYKKADLKILIINGTRGEKVEGTDLLLASEGFNFITAGTKPLSDLSKFNPDVVIIHEAGNIELFKKLLSLFSTKKYNNLFLIKVRDTHDLTRPKVKHKQVQYFMQPVEPNEIIQFINKKYNFI